MIANLAALAYLVSGVLFILALRGLSSPETSRRGNALGMTGMVLAVVVTLYLAGVHDRLTWGMIIVGVAIGGTVGDHASFLLPSFFLYWVSSPWCWRR